MSKVRPFARGLVLYETAGDENESIAAGVQAIEAAAGDDIDAPRMRPAGGDRVQVLQRRMTLRR